MCGILGFSGPKPVDPTDIKILLLFSQTRGTHATGFATLDTVEKSNENAPYFVATHPIPKTNLIIGHTRNPSYKSKKDEENAQPFDFEKFVGIHNGYFRNSYQMRQEYNLEYTHSDSYLFFYGMHETSFEEAINEADYADTLALAWIDKQTETLHLFRDGKPTFLGQKDGGIYFASEKDFLVAIDCDNITQTKEHHHYIIKDGKIKSNKKFEYEKKVIKQVTGYQHGYRETTHKYVENDTKYSNVPKIGALHAPKDAHSIFINGKKIYYWLEEDVVNVEVCVSYKNSEKKQYKLSNDHEAKKLGREYYRILKSVNEILE